MKLKKLFKHKLTKAGLGLAFEFSGMRKLKMGLKLFKALKNLNNDKTK